MNARHACRTIAVAVSLWLTLSPARAHAAECIYVTDQSTNTLDIVDVQQRQVLSRIPVTGQAPHEVVVIGDKAYVAPQGPWPPQPTTVSVVDLSARTETALIPVGSYPSGMVTSPDGSILYVVNQADGSVSVIDTRRDAVTVTINTGVYPIDLAISPAGTVYAAGMPDIAVLCDNQIVRQIPLPAGGAVAIAYWARSEGDLLLVADETESRSLILAIDPQLGAVRFTIPNAGIVSTRIALDAQAGRLYWGTALAGELVAADLATHQIIATIFVDPTAWFEYDVEGVALSGDGKTAYATGGFAGEMSIVDLETLERTDGIPVGNGFGLAVASCPPFPTATPTPVCIAPTRTWTPYPVGGCGDGILQPDRGEECDDGGTCIGGSDAGTHCTAETQCHGNGVCIGGAQAATACADDSSCPGGSCVHCVPQGGDGCAANCTNETEVVMNMTPGELVNGALKPGTSGSIVYTDTALGALVLPFQPGTTQTLAVGKPRNGQIPVVVLAASVYFPKIDVGGLACACVRGVADETCGGYLLEATGNCSVTATQGCHQDSDCPGETCIHAAAIDCTPGFIPGTCSGTTLKSCSVDSDCPKVTLPDTSTLQNCVGGVCADCRLNSDCSGGGTCVMHACDGRNSCAFVNGPGMPNSGGNSGSGIISCVPGLQGVDSYVTQDSRCDDLAVFGRSGSGPAGSAVLFTTTAIGQALGPCTAQGLTYCTDADPILARGTPTTLPSVTGTASAEMFDINAAPYSCTGGECVVDGVPDGTPCSVDADCSQTLCACPEGLTWCDLALCSGPITISGQPLGSCDQLTGSSPNVSGLGLAGAFTACPAVVTNLLMGGPAMTPRPTATASPTPMPTATSTPTPTPSGTATPSSTPTVSPSRTPSPTRTVADAGGDGCNMTGTQAARSSSLRLVGALLWIAWRRRRGTRRGSRPFQVSRESRGGTMPGFTQLGLV